MNAKTILPGLFLPLLFVVNTVILFITTTCVVEAQTSRAVNGEDAVCTIKANAKTYVAKPNQLGYFDEVSGMYPGQTVSIEVYYSKGVANQKVLIGVVDGGSLDGGKGILVAALDNQRKVSFTFKVFDLGRHRITLRKDKDVKTVQIWGDKQTGFSSEVDKNGVNTAGASPSGNTSPKGAGTPASSPPPPGGCPDPDDGSAGTNPFVANTGNESRSIQDLEIWGGVGQIQFKWMRYGNSRHGPFRTLLGDGHNWNHSFKYEMSDAGFNGNGQPKVFIHLPEGGELTFTKSKTVNFWGTLPGVGSRLVQKKDTFTLTTDKGYQYRFEKLRNPSGDTYYQLQSYLDAFQNKYNLYYDNFYRLDSITEPAGRYFKIDYDSINGKDEIRQVRTSDGRNVKYHYTIFNDKLTSWVLLDSVYYGDGTVATYTYSQREPGEQPSLEHAKDPRYTGPAVDMKYTYDTVANYTGFINEEKNGVTGETMSTLIAENNKRTICYPNGKTEVFVVPGELGGHVAMHFDGLGRTRQNTFAGGNGFLLTSTDELGRTTTYNKRTIYGNLLEITYPDGIKQKWTRDDLDLILTFTDELVRITKYTRDANHRVIRIDYPDRTFETFTYNSYGQELDHRQQNGGVTHAVYDTRGLRTGFTDAEGSRSQYTYDKADRLATSKDALGRTTKYSYNERGLLTTLTNADGSKKFYEYDQYGNRTKITDELKNSWVTKYDEFRRPVTVTDPLNRVTTYKYDLPGSICGCTHDNINPTKIILPSGKVTERQYDIEWQIIRETAGAGTPDAATTFYEYDQVGNQVVVVDPNEKVWAKEYDSRNRLISSTDPLGHKTGYKYDLVGNLIKITRPDSGTIVSFYDNMNRDTLNIDPKGQKTMMAYDSAGNLVKLVDPKNHLYSFNYDLLNRKTKLFYPDLYFDGYTYDSVGNLKTYTSRIGVIRTYEYDKMDREIKSSWFSPFGDTTPAINNTYDAAGRLLTMKSGVSSLTYAYSKANELTSENQAVTGAAGPKTIRYSYIKDGLLNSVTYPDSTVVKYAYTPRNQVASISANNVTLAQYAYDLNGNRLSKILKNGTDVIYTLDEANRLFRLLNRKAAARFAGFEYGYDNMNRKTYVKRGNGNGDVYSYDATGQIVKVLYEAATPDSIAGTPARTVTYKWDPVGNRQVVVNNGTSTIYSTNFLNEYFKVGDSALRHTRNGNLTNFNGWTFTYDGQKRLVLANKSDTTIRFAYDPLNRCVQRKVSKGKLDVSNTFLYYDGWNLIEERNALDSQMARYIHGALTDELLSKTSNSNAIYYHYDALGSVVQLTDSTGKMVERYVADDVFGKTSIRDSNGKRIPESAYGNRFMFTGREYLKEIKLYDFRNRMYSDSLGRFVQMDPLGFDAGDYNFYRYVGNNPVSSIDPFGLEETQTCPDPKKKKPEETEAERKAREAREAAAQAAKDEADKAAKAEAQRQAQIEAQRQAQREADAAEEKARKERDDQAYKDWVRDKTQPKPKPEPKPGEKDPFVPSGLGGTKPYKPDVYSTNTHPNNIKIYDKDGKLIK